MWKYCFITNITNIKITKYIKYITVILISIHIIYAHMQVVLTLPPYIASFVFSSHSFPIWSSHFIHQIHSYTYNYVFYVPFLERIIIPPSPLISTYDLYKSNYISGSGTLHKRWLFSSPIHLPANFITSLSH